MKRLTAFLLFTVLITVAFAQKCPRGLNDCPGLCGWYIDKDGDHFCDIGGLSDRRTEMMKLRADSLASVEAKRKADSAAAEKKNNPPQKSEPAAAGNPNPNPAEARTASGHQGCPFAKTCEAGTKDTLSTGSGEDHSPEKAGVELPHYDFITIGAIVLVLYLLTSLLAARGKIRKYVHRKIWNTLLLITFLVSGLLGLFMVVQLNYNFTIDWFRSLLFYHVQFGIGMAFIAILHVVWHWKYFARLFRKPVKPENCPE